MSLMSLTAVELGKKIKAKEVTVTEAVTAALDAIEAKEKKVNSFVTVDREGALKRAEEVQKMIDEGTLTGPLAGVPVAIKDNMCTKDLLTTCSSKILYNFKPTYTAEAVENLEKAVAVIIGKTNMDEFAMGSTTETSAYGATKNPWNEAHVPGGSSGGSCAAVAAEECSYALGSDTGGSIRQPSSFCGVTGIKPTYGTVSRYGLIAYGSSLDQIGPIAKDVTDCATILEAIASYDKKDSTSIARDVVHEGVQKFPQVIFGRIIQRGQDGDGGQSAVLGGFSCHLGPLGFQHLSAGQIARPLAEEAAADKARAPPHHRRQALVLCEPDGIARQLFGAFESYIHRLMPRPAARPCRRCRRSGCRRSS